LAKRLLSLIEAGGYPDFRPLYEALGFEVAAEYSVRRAQGRVREFMPDVLVADFYKRYFHDRVSNLESLLSLQSKLPGMYVIVIYDPFHQADIEQLRHRFRIHATLPLPVHEHDLRNVLLALDIDQD
jgi:hypothetical protein